MIIISEEVCSFGEPVDDNNSCCPCIPVGVDRFREVGDDVNGKGLL